MPGIAGMMSGTVRMILGVLLLILSVYALKILHSNLLWIGIVVGAVLGMNGGIAVSHTGIKIDNAD
jgi:uncharacterized membrane protein HdeD (DUF308 family)